MTTDEAIKELTSIMQWQNSHPNSNAYIEGYIAGLQFAIDVLNEAIPPDAD